MELVVVRPGTAADLETVRAIQRDAPEAAQWAVGEYLNYQFAVAEREGQPVGFAVWREVGEGEWELLNLAVAKGARRGGIGAKLIEKLPAGRVFLEVRASNEAALALYSRCGFRRLGVRKKYYQFPTDDGIVMERQK